MRGPVGYAYDAALHCEACARARFGAALDDGTAVDSEGNEPHPIFSWDEGDAHGEHCDDCSEEISPAWCDGCEHCAPNLAVHVATNEDNPWSVTVMARHADPAALERWLAWKGGYFGGSTWESGGEGFVYACPGIYPGVYAEWRKEGYDLDLSEAPDDDPLAHFDGMTAEELEERFVHFRSYMGMGPDDEASIREAIAARAAKAG